MISLDTPRLHLRNFVSEDAPALYECTRQYTASPMGIYDFPWPDSLEEIQKSVDWFASGDSFAAVTLKETGQYIGFVDLMKSEDPEKKEYELGYLFNFDFHGKGYATEACTAVLKYAFETLGAEKINAGTAQANLASRKVLRKLGFAEGAEVKVAFHKDEQGNPIEFLGNSFELTKEMWEKQIA